MNAKKNILIIDDDQDSLEVMTEYLKDISSIAITTLGNPLDTFQVLSSQDFDLLITDILMPHMSGLELISKLKKEFPLLKILACSGGGETGSIIAGLALDQAIDEGARSAITKPFSEVEFRSRVLRLLGIS